ncbi:hypothetical protein Baya_13419 [Bagarius yarrelli]|uniref:Uncharacterized protein n=1 Tax=Bagarius yarrelli TaxID=175774 RepID=A0A556V5R0_BAGYA|nr:hypothetical protein Baya_13419 [Bagarius yarrelli]
MDEKPDLRQRLWTGSTAPPPPTQLSFAVYYPEQFSEIRLNSVPDPESSCSHEDSKRTYPLIVLCKEALPPEAELNPQNSWSLSSLPIDVGSSGQHQALSNYVYVNISTAGRDVAGETAYASQRLSPAKSAAAAQRVFLTSRSAAGMSEDACSTNQCFTGI